MDAQNSNLELPRPQTAQPQSPTGSLPGNPLTQPVTSPLPLSSPVAPLPNDSLPPQFAQSASADGSIATATQADTPASADDADLIEKEWVIKAKQIVQQTKEDPYTQNKEITKFKAEYMKKRYNRDIKLIEE